MYFILINIDKVYLEMEQKWHPGQYAIKLFIISWFLSY